VNKLWLPVLIFFWLFANSVAGAAGTVDYTVTVQEGNQDRLEVLMEFPAPGPNPHLKLPRWMPGAYLLADLARHLEELDFRDADGNQLEVIQTAGNSWLLTCPEGSRVKVHYYLRVSKHGFMGRALTLQGGRLFAGTTLLYLDGYLDLPARVTLHLPPGWQGVSGLPQTTPLTWEAEDYHQLVDSPIYFGNIPLVVQEVTRKEQTVPLLVAVQDGSPAQAAALTELITTITETELDFFQRIPFDRYAFLIHLTAGDAPGGGLEHRNSASLGLSAKLLENDPHLLAPVIAHELFHAWNMKSFYPRGFRNFDYDRELRTTTLWLGEGLTEYYAWLLTLRAGIISRAEFLEKTEKEISILESNPRRLDTSLAEASRNIWEAGHGGGLSYYNKGFLVSLLLDLQIRSESRGKFSLDDFCRLLDQRFGAVHNDGYSDEQLLWTLREVLPQAEELLDDYVFSTTPLPWELLSLAGLAVELRRRTEPWAGELSLYGRDLRFYLVGTESPLGRAGVQRGDALKALDGRSCTTKAQAQAQISRHQPGDTLLVTLERHGKTVTLPVVLDGREKVTAEIHPLENAPKEARELREHWLGTDR